MLIETVLTMMLTIGPPPGVSSHSVVEATGPDDRPCDDARPACRAPWLDKKRGWLRVEQPAEGLKRYWTIARAVAAVAGKDEQLARILVVTLEGESSFRRDIHSGELLGDARQSWGPAQIKLGVRPERKTIEGWRADSLIGIGYQPTWRSVKVATRYLERGRRGCGKYAHASCWWVAYSGGFYGPKHKPIQQRARKYYRLIQPLRPLKKWHRDVLGLNETDAPGNAG